MASLKTVWITFNLVVISSIVVAQEPVNKMSNEEFIQRKLRFKSRKYLISGSMEYKEAKGAGSHSQFSGQFLEALRGLGGSNGILTTSELKGYMEVIRDLPTMGNFGSFEEGGDFLFNSGEQGDRKNYALIVGTDMYDEYGPLTDPVKDAGAIGEELKESYGFEVQFIQNPTLSMVKENLLGLNRRSYSDEDQVLIYFAGHGYFNESAKQSYIIPKDGKRNDPEGTSYLAYSDLAKIADDIPCRHIMVILDVCHGELSP